MSFVILHHTPTTKKIYGTSDGHAFRTRKSAENACDRMYDEPTTTKDDSYEVFELENLPLEL